MHKQSIRLALLLLSGLLLGACAGPQVDRSQASSAVVQGEPILAFMDIGGVT